jgi:DNA-binding MarR family transcriptional regulator
MKPSAFLGTKLRHLNAELDAAVQAQYDRMGVPFRPRFFPVAKALLAAPAGIGDLARRAGVSQPAMTQTIGEMRRAGLVEPHASADRRARLVALSPLGHEVVGRLAPLWAAIDAAAEELDLAVPQRLSVAIEGALRALEADPFSHRIARHMDGADRAGDADPPTLPRAVD